jgi:hypothetical protein
LACLASKVEVESVGGVVQNILAQIYVADAVERASRALWTHHKIFNMVIELGDSGDRASAVVDVVIDPAGLDDAGAVRRGS